MKAVPIDVMRDVANKVNDLKGQVMKLNREARDKQTEAEALQIVQYELDDMLKKWQSLFPETLKEY